MTSIAANPLGTGESHISRGANQMTDRKKDRAGWKKDRAGFPGWQIKWQGMWDPGGRFDCPAGSKRKPIIIRTVKALGMKFPRIGGWRNSIQVVLYRLNTHSPSFRDAGGAWGVTQSMSMCGMNAQTIPCIIYRAGRQFCWTRQLLGYNKACRLELHGG